MDSDKLGSVDIVGLHERALDSVAELIQGVSQDRMGSPTPCEGWEVCTLLAHLVGGNRRYEALAEGIPMPKRDQGAGSVPPASVVDDLLGSDPVAAYCESAEALKGAWRDDARLEELYDLPFGRLPGRMVLGMHLLETVAHGWDLARATEQQRVPAIFSRSEMQPQHRHKVEGLSWRTYRAVWGLSGARKHVCGWYGRDGSRPGDEVRPYATCRAHHSTPSPKNVAGTQQQTCFNPEVVRVAWAMARLALSGERSPGIPFASAVDPPEGASEEDRLAAFLGRRP